MTQKIREALLAMGYTERKEGHWLKPVGYQCFSYHEDKNEWANWFLDGQGKIAVWETKQFKEPGPRHGSHLGQLKEWECWTRTDLYVHGQSKFEMAIPDWERSF
jgi:hypothetical protein